MVLFTGPFFFIVINSFKNPKSETDHWNFLLTETLPSLISNTFILIISCVLLTLLFGFIQAVLTTITDLKFKKYLHLFFIIPLAYPLYVISYIYVGMFEYGGEIATFFRESFNLNILSLINIKHPLSIALIFSFVLSPYSYLFFRSFLIRMNYKQIWCARSLGKTPFQTLLSVIIPQAKPWIIAVSILISLEVLCDFGGVSIFNYETFTVAIYEAWMGLFSLNSAIKLSLLPLLLALIFFGLNLLVPIHNFKIDAINSCILFSPNIAQKFLIFVSVFIYLFFSLMLPLGVLLFWFSSNFSISSLIAAAPYLFDTLLLGFSAGIILSFLSLLYLTKERLTSAFKPITSFLKIGYALPGTIVAIALMNILSIFNLNYFGTLAYIILILGLTIRFFAPVYDLQYNSYASISMKNDWASRSLGASKSKTFFQVHLPLLRPALISSFLLGFLEIIKEMPITMILRPHNTNTLSTKIYELTSEGEWEQTSIFALTLFVFGALSLYSVSKKEEGL